MQEVSKVAKGSPLVYGHDGVGQSCQELQATTKFGADRHDASITVSTYTFLLWLTSEDVGNQVAKFICRLGIASLMVR